MKNTLKEISVIGAGTMGIGIAQLFAQYNYKVRLIDLNATVIQKAKTQIEDQLALLRDYDFITSSDLQAAMVNIFVSTRLEDASQSWLIVEAVPEKMELKQELFRKLETICAETVIFTTNTSGLSINTLASVLKYPERFIGTHFFMPASIIPLIELVQGEQTAETTTNEVLKFFRGINKKPVLVKKDIPGFIGNRIQHAMAREAISLLEEGVATAEDIDEVIRWSLGVRLLFTGPLEQRDLNGLDVHMSIATYLYKDLNNRTEPAKLLTDKVERGDLGIKTGKGFYEWDEKERKDVLEKKNSQLLQLMKTLKTMASELK